jgi:dihydroorotate dehydrogenase (fumarate)
MTLNPETVRQLVEAGAGAIVLPSIHQRSIENALNISTEASVPLPQRVIEQDNHAQQLTHPQEYLAALKLVKRVSDLPIIASMSGGRPGQWLDFAKEIELSGADAFELNLVTDLSLPACSAEQIESQLCETVRGVRRMVSIPLAVKLSPRATNLSLLAHRMKMAGAEAVIIYSHQPTWDICLERKEWKIKWELSPVDSLGTTLEGIARSKYGNSDLIVAASGGIRTGEDAIKAVLAGAEVVVVVSEIYRCGPCAVRDIIDSIVNFLASSEQSSWQQLLDSRPGLSSLADSLQELSRGENWNISASPHDYRLPPVRHPSDKYGHTC